MPAPTSYTEAELATFMHTVVGRVATVLAWTNPASYTEPISETLLAYGVSAIASATDIRKLRALARREVWRSAVDGFATNHDFSTDGQSFSRSQMQRQSAIALKMAEDRALAFDDQYAIHIHNIRHKDDPYIEVPDSMRE